MLKVIKCLSLTLGFMLLTACGNSEEQLIELKVHADEVMVSADSFETESEK